MSDNTNIPSNRDEEIIQILQQGECSEEKLAEELGVDLVQVSLLIAELINSGQVIDRLMPGVTFPSTHYSIPSQ